MCDGTRKRWLKREKDRRSYHHQNQKAVEQKADRTIFDFSEQPQLNSGTALDGIKKLPGLVSSDVAGMLYQGKMLDVFMDGRPLNISSNELNAFLEGMPANSIDRIEIITQPGAEFPATSGGAILNIITSKTAKNYLTATYSGNYSLPMKKKYAAELITPFYLTLKINGLVGSLMWGKITENLYLEGIPIILPLYLPTDGGVVLLLKRQ